MFHDVLGQKRTCLSVTKPEYTQCIGFRLDLLRKISGGFSSDLYINFVSYYFVA